jgi:SAM-dependent methyltransferase
MGAETDILNQVQCPKEKTFVDLGAGHGRILPQAADLAKQVISIELNPDMLPELRRRSREHDNAEIVVGDVTKLTSLLSDEDIDNPVLLLLQNTLGTVEGDEDELLDEMNSFSRGRGEIIISLFQAEALPTWGVNELYPSVQDMVGRPDVEASSFKEGIFRSTTGYESKWWFEDEIQQIINGFDGAVKHEQWEDHFYVGHLSLR